MSDHSALKNDAKDQINGHEITCDPVAVLALITEVEALRKDAERYQWLRDKSEALHSFYLSVPIWMTGVKFNKDTVDSTIDTMRAGADQ